MSTLNYNKFYQPAPAVMLEPDRALGQSRPALVATKLLAPLRQLISNSVPGLNGNSSQGF